MTFPKENCFFFGLGIELNDVCFIPHQKTVAFARFNITRR